MLTIDTRTPAPRCIGSGLDDAAPTPRPGARRKLTTATRPPRRRPTTTAPAAPELPLAAAEAAEAAEAVAILAPLVPGSDGVPLVRLARMVAAKLAGHGAHCAATFNPPRGSLTVDEVRTRCRALHDALAPVERQAALALVTHDVREASR